MFTFSRLVHALTCILALAVVRPSLAIDEDDWGIWMDDGYSRSRDSGETRDESEELMSLLQSVAHQMTSLKSIIHNLKINSQIIYKQVHKLYKHKCQNALSKKHRGFVAGWKELVSSGKEDLPSPAYQNQEASASSEPTKSSCPTGFQLNSEAGKCYRVESAQRVSWLLARDRCKAIGAELLSIGSAREQSIIGEMLRKKHAAKCDYWTGLTATRRTTTPLKSSPGQKPSSSSSSGSVPWSDGHRRRSSASVGGGEVHWYWSGDGSSLGRYANWNDNEPNDVGGGNSARIGGPGDGAGGGGGGGGGVCVQMLWIFDWKWNDASCAQATACFICQTPLPSSAAAGSKDALVVRGRSRRNE